MSNYKPRHAAANKVETEVKSELRRRLTFHGAWLIVGILITIAAIYLHWDLITAIAAPVASPVAQEVSDFIFKL